MGLEPGWGELSLDRDFLKSENGPTSTYNSRDRAELTQEIAKKSHKQKHSQQNDSIYYEYLHYLTMPHI